MCKSFFKLQSLFNLNFAISLRNYIEPSCYVIFIKKTLVNALINMYMKMYEYLLF